MGLVSASGSLRNVLGTVYRALPASWRFGRDYVEFARLAAEAPRWDPETIRNYQVKELRRVLHHAANHCPYYQQSFPRAGFRPESVRTLDDLRDCPFLDPATLTHQRDKLGSTATLKGPRKFSSARERAFEDAMWQRAGYTRGCRLARFSTNSLNPAGAPAEYDSLADELILSREGLEPERLGDVFRALQEFRPSFLQITPSMAIQAFEQAGGAGQNWPVPLRAVLCGGDPLPLSQKQALERFFACNVYRWFRDPERVVMAGQGTVSSLYYFWPIYGLVEFGAADPSGWCEIIGTSFHQFGLPLIRYRTGVFARLADPRRDGDLELPWPAAAELAFRSEHA